MLDNTLTIDYGSVSGITLTRVNQDNYSSDYYGESGDMKFKLSVKHSIPGRGDPGESHLVRLDVDHFDSEGVFQRTSSAWIVIKTFDGVQDSSEAALAVAALQDFIGVPANTDKVIARES